MKIGRLLLYTAVVCLVGPVLLAAGLDKYKSWPSSPQGYFMTNAERAEWKANVKTDADAEQFVQKFLASRGPGFAEDVAKRADIADKRLSVAGRAGSQTLRGKIVILLGPPSGFGITPRESKGERSASAAAYAGVGGGSSLNAAGGSANGASVADMIEAANRANMSVRLLNDYTFTYAAATLPGKPAKDLIVIVEVNPADGTDKINDNKAARELDEIFEKVAVSRLASAAAPAPKP